MGLIITRRLDEGIVVDGELLIKVIKIVRGQVRLHIEGPKSIKIDRLEEMNEDTIDKWRNRAPDSGNE